MHFPAIATGFRLLAKCFIKSPIPSSVGKVLTAASITPIVDVAMQSVEPVETPVEVMKTPVGTVTEVVGKQAGGASEKTMAETMRSTRTTVFQMFQPLARSSKVQVECARKEGVLQAHAKKEWELVAAKHPIASSMVRKAERGEADELMDKVLRMFEDIDEMEKFRLQLRVAVYDEDPGDGVQVKEDPTPLNRWIDSAKEAEIALDIARCEMTIEDVDDLLTRLYIEMNYLVVVHATNKEERKRMAVEVSARIKEYAEVLLESQCEIRLAVERARVRSVVAKRFTPSDAEYLASLTPGSSHIPSCDRSCVSSYLLHRVAENSEDESIPELTRSEASRCSTPSEVPSTPRASITELQAEPSIIITSEEVKPVEVVPVKSQKMADSNMVANRAPVRKATTVTGGGKPTWRF
ncbi:unnamed protein product [Rhizoctonia solani]|uniref:Uncharacterized protein n=1 Tax=Rhizoctonia solani TaxID=456999 RepID=A0A8H3CY64_9AGAM|nr:unnamed protein product [Rhizoctonia solani]